MKINRFLALAAIAVLVVAAMGLVTAQSSAQSGTPSTAVTTTVTLSTPVTTTVTTDPAACANDQADGTEVKDVADTDTIDLQCGDQNAPDTSTDADNVDEQVGDQNAPDTSADAEVKDGPDTDNVDEQVGDQNAPDTGADAEVKGNDAQDAAPIGTPTITAAAAQKAAEDYLHAGSASKVTLDDENGKLVYSVEINGTDVKVDALTGAVLSAQSDQD